MDRCLCPPAREQCISTLANPFGADCKAISGRGARVPTGATSSVAARTPSAFAATKFSLAAKFPVVKILAHVSTQTALTLVGPGSTAPPPPRTLGPHGLSLWARVQREYHILDCGGVELLCLACQALDRAESLSEAIAADGETVRTRTGIRAHPALRDELCEQGLHHAGTGEARDRH